MAHLDDLWALAAASPESFAHLRYGPFGDKSDLKAVLEDLSTRADQPFWAVVPKGRTASGWLSICDIYQEDGSIEIGSIWFSPGLQGSREGREAIYLLMCRAMDELGYERLVWRCMARNRKSYGAAENLGFTYEGTWRNALNLNGEQFDVAWFSILRNEWASRRDAFTKWLSPDNFDADGRQRQKLGGLRS